ncbi:hypothetical protein [Carboxylicivirga linearis]|uniref:Uncharacterized protein n=1 Tax=Carboxylicivirga linearis TaxID=1628157 RepID=A0ABS5JP49_9BACT|nr:hypothetical protein [Carboxylicivirga linearis]MBS2096638.1 hypothetical protein [Carboxylicivirga linearis]
MVRIQFLLLVFCISFIAKAQNESMIGIIGHKDSTHISYADSLSDKRFLLGKPILEDKLNRFSLTTEVGTSVAVNFDGGFGTNLYVAPQLWYVPNEKWQFNVTPVISRSTYHDMPIWIAPGYVSTFDGTATHVGLYAQGSYNVNEKLYVGGSVMANSTMFENDNISMPVPNLNSIGTSAFVGYKFSDSFKVEAEFGVGRNTNGNFNTWGSPMNPFMMTPRTRNPYDRY